MNSSAADVSGTKGFQAGAGWKTCGGRWLEKLKTNGAGSVTIFTGVTTDNGGWLKKVLIGGAGFTKGMADGAVPKKLLVTGRAGPATVATGVMDGDGLPNLKVLLTDGAGPGTVAGVKIDGGELLNLRVLMTDGVGLVTILTRVAANGDGLPKKTGMAGSVTVLTGLLTCAGAELISPSGMEGRCGFIVPGLMTGSLWLTGIKKSELKANWIFVHVEIGGEMCVSGMVELPMVDDFSGPSMTSAGCPVVPSSTGVSVRARVLASSSVASMTWAVSRAS